MSRTHKCSLSGVRDPALLDFLQKIADSLDTTQLGIERLGRDVYAEFSIFTKAFETHCGPEDTWGSQILELVHKAVQRNAEVDRAVGAIVGNALADAVGILRDCLGGCVAHLTDQSERLELGLGCGADVWAYVFV